MEVQVLSPGPSRSFSSCLRAMQFRQLSQAAAIASVLPGVGRLASLISSGVFTVLGIQHLFQPIDYQFTTFLFFHFVSMLPMALVVSTLLFAVSSWRRKREGKKDPSLDTLSFAVLALGALSPMFAVAFYVYFYLSFQLLGGVYTFLSIIYLLPIFWISVKQTERYILTVLVLFLAATLLTWVALALNDFIWHFPLSGQLEHMKRLPNLGAPGMVYIQMSILFIIANGFAVYEILSYMIKEWCRRMRHQKSSHLRKQTGTLHRT